jgi:two-component system, OmpR family, sensor kinase
MKGPRSLQARLGLSIGVLLTVLWIAAASVTAVVLRHEMDEVFDSALQETAQRLLPLAVVDIVGREEDGVTQRLGAIREHDEFFAYIVRDAEGRILLQSHAADPAVFPAYDGPGFRQTATHRLFNDDVLQGSVRITVAEPLDHRAAVAHEIQMVLGLPILVVIPVALLAIILAVRAALVPLRRFRESLEARSAGDLSPAPAGDLPAEIRPVAGTLNGVLDRLKAAFDAERSFAANTAHELRTPLAGAIAQAQRLRVETKDANAAHRAADIEASLKRLTRMAERLLQLARAEGGPLRLDHASDLRIVARLIVEDIKRTAPPGQIVLTLPERPVLSDLDPDAVGIVCRNLVENALRHGAPHGPIDVTLAEDGTFRVANDGPVIPAETLDHLTLRFERGGTGKEGSGLGLAIVAAIADRISSRLTLRSPRPGKSTGFEATLILPVALH